MAVKTTGWPSVDKLLKEADALQKEFVELDQQIDEHLSKHTKPLPSMTIKKYKIAKLSSK
ncbi:hypothetical protein [Brevibacillus centrosporus]|jgi:hypothetical protein|uniref:hypothetical protein n=1 Tax=Brevibacillus centrosporus TaxID=54910 RepID=UPI0039883B1E